jgi:hypothetical protein
MRTIIEVLVSLFALGLIGHIFWKWKETARALATETALLDATRLQLKSEKDNYNSLWRANRELWSEVTRERKNNAYYDNSSLLVKIDFKQRFHDNDLLEGRISRDILMNRMAQALAKEILKNPSNVIAGVEPDFGAGYSTIWCRLLVAAPVLSVDKQSLRETVRFLNIK